MEKADKSKEVFTKPQLLHTIKIKFVKKMDYRYSKNAI